MAGRTAKKRETMKQHLLTIIIIGCVTSLISLQAQSIDSLLQECLSENRMLAALETTVRAEAYLPQQVNRLPEPELGINAFILPVETRLGPQHLRLGVTQMLPWKGTLDARSTAAGFSERIAENQLERTSIDMAYRIKLDYFDLYRARRSVAIAKKQQEWLNNLRSLARSRLESSAGNLAALTQIDLKIRELDWKMGQFFREAEIQVQAINQWRNRPGNTPVLTPEVLGIAGLPIPGGEIPARHPELRDAELRQLQSDARVAVIQLERKPSFGVGLDYITVGARTDMDMPRNGRDILSPRVNIRIPLYAGVYDARIGEQQLRREALELSKSDAYNKLEQAAAQSLLQWQAAVEELDWIESHLEGLEQLIRLKISAWESGQGNFDDILNLYLEQENFSWRAMQAELRSHQAKAARERALGIVY